jgi:DNA-binding sugar fermentation-stimulating protein
LPFTIAKEIDPKYNEALKEAMNSGVEVLVYQSDITLEEINLKKKSSLQI